MNEITIVSGHKKIWRNNIHTAYRILELNILISGPGKDRMPVLFPIPPAKYC